MDVRCLTSPLRPRSRSFEEVLSLVLMKILGSMVVWYLRWDGMQQVWCAFGDVLLTTFICCNCDETGACVFKLIGVNTIAHEMRRSCEQVV